MIRINNKIDNIYEIMLKEKSKESEYLKMRLKLAKRNSQGKLSFDIIEDGRKCNSANGRKHNGTKSKRNNKKSIER